MRTPHTSCSKGKRVRLVLRDGTEIKDKFIERTDKYVFLEYGKYAKRSIKSFSILKNL